MCRPVNTFRSNSRNKPSTVDGYLDVLLPFVERINKLTLPITVDELGYQAGIHSVSLNDSKVRIFHASLGYFLPFINRTRVTAELKGLEKLRPSTPASPLTFPLLIALSAFCSWTYGFAQAVGVVIGFFGLLRAQEISKIRKIDVMIRGGDIKLTTIRLGQTKNGREQVVQFAPNCLAELMLVKLCKHTTNPYAPLFGFRKYTDVYRVVLAFNDRFQLNLRFRPHSLRAGGATYYRAQGWQIADIQDLGRWANLNTAKGYIDLVFTLLPECKHAEQQVAPTAQSALTPLCAAKF